MEPLTENPVYVQSPKRWCE